MKTDFSQIPATEGVYKLAKGEGESFDVVGARFTWKVKGDKTAYAFSVYEQTLDPGEGVPPHSHAYAEVFYLLGGAVDFLDGKEDWVRCESGETPARAATIMKIYGCRTNAMRRSTTARRFARIVEAFEDNISRARGRTKTAPKTEPAPMEVNSNPRLQG